MNRSTLKSLPKQALALILTAALLIPSALADAGTSRLSTEQTLVDGLTYRNTITEHSTAGRVESFSFELEPDSTVYPIMVQSAGTAYGAATINKAISYAEELGYHVVGGINSDFFTLGNGIPNGISIEDGVYKSSPEGNHAISLVDGHLRLSTVPQVEISLTNQRDSSVVSLTHFNKWRNSAGGLYLYNEDFSTVSTHTDAAGGRMVRFQVVEEDRDTPLTVNSTLTLEVVEVLETADAVPIGEDNYILTAAYESGFYDVFANYLPGDRVTLTTTCSDPNLSQAQWASGCGDVMISDGALTNSATWHYTVGRDPRTAVGVKEDGTMLFYVADGRQSGYSGGLTQVDLAEELLRQGCVWAVNLDGGGSSTFAVRLPGTSGLTIANSPSGGSLRACATYILLVTDPAASDGVPERLALKEDGLVVLSGSSVTLGDVAALDQGADTVSSRVSDAVFTSTTGLGSFNGGVYTAGNTAGTDTIRIDSPSLGISGSAQIHVVNSLSDLTVTRAGSNAALSSLSVEVGESVSLSASGAYWSRTALRAGAGGVTWAVTGDVGTITSDGVFTASGSGSSGTITATAGGITKTISVNLSGIHTDVTPDHWSYEAVEYCYDHGIVSGISSTEFGRDNSIRRGDFVLMLYNALGKPAVSGTPAFTDVAASDYYASAVTWASANGLVSGVSEGVFAPTDLVTREQAFTILHQAMPLLDIDSPDPDLTVLDQFADQAQIANYARPHMAALVSQGLASGTGGSLNPKGNLTRAEMAALLYRLLTFNGSEPVEEPEPAPDLDPDASLTLDTTESTLASTQSLQLNATLTGGEGTILWSSSDPTVATVDADGVVTNVYSGSGTPTVTITAACGSLTASADIQCSPAEVVGQVTAEPSLNVRSGPSLDDEIISSLKYGAYVIVLDMDTPGWYQVLFSNGTKAVTGWVSADYLVLT